MGSFNIYDLIISVVSITIVIMHFKKIGIIGRKKEHHGCDDCDAKDCPMRDKKE